MRPVVDELVADGLVRRVAVADGGPPVVVPAGAERRRHGAGRRRAALPVRQPALGPAVRRARVRLPPLIEVYKREHERVYGYYVLPFLSATGSSAAPI